MTLSQEAPAAHPVSTALEAPIPSVHGIVSHQVVQRADALGSELRLTGSSPTAPAQLLLVRGNGTVVAATPLAETRWKASLAAPTGGPYDLLLEDAGGAQHLLAADLLVGDLWVLAGQSNMQGIGHLRNLEPPSPHVHVLDMARRWRVAVEPLHQLSLSPDAVHVGGTEEDRVALRTFDEMLLRGAGLGVAFGRAMVESTGVPVGLIATAHGGTSLGQWSPELADQGGNSLFGSTLLSVLAAGGRVAGVLWYQGESETGGASPCTFTEDLDRLVAGLRAHLGEAVPFYHVQLGRFVSPDMPDPDERRWSLVRELQRRFPAADGVVTAVDLDLDDLIHIGTAGLRRLGRRLARLASGAGGPVQPRSVTAEEGGLTLRVRFDNITGRLQPAQGRVWGFSVRTPDEDEVPVVYHAEVAASGDSVELRLVRPLGPGESVWYGWGFNPCCNLVDEADMAVPAFGPMLPEPVHP